MSIEFMPPIDLTFGFTLNAVGGVIGIEHRLDTDALRAEPADRRASTTSCSRPTRSRPRRRSSPRSSSVFPFDPGSIVIGPMIEIGWGRPVSFLTAQLGVIAVAARSADRDHRPRPHRAAGAAAADRRSARDGLRRDHARSPADPGVAQRLAHRRASRSSATSGMLLRWGG